MRNSYQNSLGLTGKKFLESVAFVHPLSFPSFRYCYSLFRSSPPSSLARAPMVCRDLTPDTGIPPSSLAADAITAMPKMRAVAPVK
jgi:hypothetical protein